MNTLTFKIKLVEKGQRWSYNIVKEGQKRGDIYAQYVRHHRTIH